MKTILFLILVLVSFSIVIAEELLIQKIDGSADTVSLSNLSKISFSGDSQNDEINLHYSAGKIDTYLFTEISKISFLQNGILSNIIFHYANGDKDTIAANDIQEALLEPKSGVNNSGGGNNIKRLAIYPIPSDSKINIELSIEKASFISVDICDINGEIIRNIIRGFKGAGDYSLAWDGNRADGISVAHGIYICRVNSGEEIFVKKIALGK